MIMNNPESSNNGDGGQKEEGNEMKGGYEHGRGSHQETLSH
jgi:hypothetical protein